MAHGKHHLYFTKKTPVILLLSYMISELFNSSLTQGAYNKFSHTETTTSTIFGGIFHLALQYSTTYQVPEHLLLQKA